ncbi:hypothetical protein H6P81_006937 [Aristolochia fimbriata]|uniref:SAM-dependent methyltransferase TRM5/TYW2-type domain-containing protein n=1 Tax=Aristolochia fimbriata TaxID=158543 RepID=A0AAV7EZ36_ARIFI|nr:hypothetical protein H6P81_006937 [Aristolochia fimbriata]
MGGSRNPLSQAERRSEMEFEERKSKVLASLSSIDYTDKSPKGSLDLPIVPLIDAINQNPSYYTTSSCSGRISILSQPRNASSVSKKKARGGSWLFITHDPADPDTVVDILFGNGNSSPTCSGDLVFRFEPFIVAVECKDVTSAQELVSTAIACGFRESGITSIHKRIMVAIRCSLRLEVPLGEIGNIMVSPKYVHYLIGIANEKMAGNRKRTDSFLQVLQFKALPELELNGKNHNCLVNRTRSSVSQTNRMCDVFEATFDKNLVPCTTEPTSLGNICDNGKDDCDAYSAGLYCKEDNGSDCSWKNPPIDLNDPSGGEVRGINSMNSSPDSHSEDAESCLSIKMTVSGEPVEKLFLWGHSACSINIGTQCQILIFGGFGGIGRHARRNDTLTLDPIAGVLSAINAERSPSPRLGHTSSTLGEHVFVIGGRGDPTQILSDVWVLNTAKGEWKSLDCSGSKFSPRHRHAAATVGSKIYLFGGLNHETIYSCLYAFDTETLLWSEISNQGEEWPCARHSHSLVASKTQLFVFGGYDGEKALGDLYSFDVRTCAWKKEKTTGKAPYARFSHSMFLYNDHLGIIGGCPIKQHFQEMSLLNLHTRVWRHVKIESVSKDLFVRGTTTVVGNNVFLIGGGASCYAFGTKFNEPTEINLHQLIYLDKIPLNMKDPMMLHKEVMGSNGNIIPGKPLVLQLERKFGKVGKDILKRFGWLDLRRKVYHSQDGLYICFPITEGSYAVLQRKAFESSGVPEISEQLTRKAIAVTSISEASDILFACEGSVLIDDLTCIKRPPKSPYKILKETVSSLLEYKGLSQQLLEQLPTRWERLGDITVLPATSFKDPIWESLGQELWMLVARSLGTQRLARQGRIVPNATRDSALEILVGDNGWVTHHENGISYSLDATKCMFSSGNLSEKVRMGRLDCRNETVVDLFAGIGYFVLPFLVKAKAKLVYACEWNPHAIAALQHNIQANCVADRCIVLEGDNRVTAPTGVADRVCLGLLPSSECSWVTGVKALRTEGGVLHVHGNVKDSDEGSWADTVAESINNIAKSEGYRWHVSVQHLERVKWSTVLWTITDGDVRSFVVHSSQEESKRLALPNSCLQGQLNNGSYRGTESSILLSTKAVRIQSLAGFLLSCSRRIHGGFEKKRVLYIGSPAGSLLSSPAAPPVLPLPNPARLPLESLPTVLVFTDSD